jgi:hypothetical protein
MNENIDIPYKDTSLLYAVATNADTLNVVADKMITQEKINKENGDYTSDIYVWMLLSHPSITPAIYRKSIEGLDDILNQEYEEGLFRKTFLAIELDLIVEIFDAASNGNKTAGRGMVYLFSGKFERTVTEFAIIAERKNLIPEEFKTFPLALVPTMMGWGR